MEKNRINFLSLPLHILEQVKVSEGCLLFSSAVIIWFSVIGHYTTPTFLATLKVSSQISSSSNYSTCDAPCWLIKAFLWKSQTQDERQGENSFTKTWQMKTAKIILWSSIWLWPYCFLNHCQQSTCRNKDTHVKWEKNPRSHDFNLFHPDCPSLSLCIGFFTSASQDPRVQDVLCFAGHAFPWLSLTGQMKTGKPAVWKTASPEHLQDLNSPKLLLYLSLLCTWGLLWIPSYTMSCLNIWTCSFPRYQTGFSTLLKT